MIILSNHAIITFTLLHNRILFFTGRRRFSFCQKAYHNVSTTLNSLPSWNKNVIQLLPVLVAFISLAELSPRFKSRQYDDTLSTILLHSSAENNILIGKTDRMLSKKNIMYVVTIKSKVCCRNALENILTILSRLHSITSTLIGKSSLISDFIRFLT